VFVVWVHLEEGERPGEMEWIVASSSSFFATVAAFSVTAAGSGGVGTWSEADLVASLGGLRVRLGRRGGGSATSLRGDGWSRLVVVIVGPVHFVVLFSQVLGLDPIA